MEQRLQERVQPQRVLEAAALNEGHVLVLFHGVLEQRVQEGAGGAMVQPQPLVLGGRGRGFQLVAEEPENSKPTRQRLEGAVLLQAFGDHLDHGHHVRVVEGCVKVHGLFKDDPGWLPGQRLHRPHRGLPCPPEKVSVGDIKERHAQMAAHL